MSVSSCQNFIGAKVHLQRKCCCTKRVFWFEWFDSTTHSECKSFIFILGFPLLALKADIFFVQCIFLPYSLIQTDLNDIVYPYMKQSHVLFLFSNQQKCWCCSSALLKNIKNFSQRFQWQYLEQLRYISQTRKLNSIWPRQYWMGNPCAAGRGLNIDTAVRQMYSVISRPLHLGLYNAGDHLR